MLFLIYLIDMMTFSNQFSNYFWFFEDNFWSAIDFTCLYTYTILISAPEKSNILKMYFHKNQPNKYIKILQYVISRYLGIMSYTFQYTPLIIYSIYVLHTYLPLSKCAHIFSILSSSKWNICFDFCVSTDLCLSILL